MASAGGRARIIHECRHPVVRFADEQPLPNIVHPLTHLAQPHRGGSLIVYSSRILDERPQEGAVGQSWFGASIEPVGVGSK